MDCYVQAQQTPFVTFPTSDIIYNTDNVNIPMLLVLLLAMTTRSDIFLKTCTQVSSRVGVHCVLQVTDQVLTECSLPEIHMNYL